MIRDYSIGQLRVVVISHGIYYSVVVFEADGFGTARLYQDRAAACQAADEIIGGIHVSTEV